MKNLSIFGKIARVGLAPFGLNMSPIISLIFINRFSMAYGGETAVACYACIAYMLTILYYLIQGVGDGSQPLMSQYYGEGNWASVKRIRCYAYVLSEILTLAGAAILFCGRAHIGVVFGASPQVSAQVAEAIPIFFDWGNILILCTHHYLWILCNRKRVLFLYFGICRAGASDWAAADFATFWRSDGCLVEHDRRTAYDLWHCFLIEAVCG